MSYLKETVQGLKKKEDKKIKTIIKEVENDKIKKAVQKKVAERNMPPVRYVGSTAVQFKITEDKDATAEPKGSHKF